MVKDLGIQCRRVVDTSVGDGRVCGAHLIIIHTVGDTSKRKRLVVKIAEYAGAGCLALDEGADSELLTIVKSKLLGDLIAQFNCTHVDGPGDGAADRGIAAVTSVGITKDIAVP